MELHGQEAGSHLTFQQHHKMIIDWSWMVVMSLKPTQLQFCFCPPTELNFHQDAKPEQENEFIVIHSRIGMSISLTAAAAGLVWPLKIVSEAPVSTDQIWTWDKMIKLLARLEGGIPPRRPQHHKWHRRRPDWRRDDSNHNQRENLHLPPEYKDDIGGD